MSKDSHHETIITGGEFGGLSIKTPGGNTHPMGSRERLALFNSLTPYIEGAFICDAFAGSGALGIEAISRGASFITFIDKSQAAVDTINQNLKDLGVFGSHGGALKADIVKEAPTATDRFHIVFSAPPYDNYIEKDAIAPSHLVADGVDGIFVLSSPTSAPEIPGFSILKSKKYARCYITIYKKA